MKAIALIDALAYFVSACLLWYNANRFESVLVIFLIKLLGFFGFAASTFCLLLILAC